MAIKFDYNETSDVLTINEDGNVTVYQLHKNKYGKLFRYIIKAIDSLDNPNYTTKSMHIYLKAYYGFWNNLYRAEPDILLDAAKTYDVTFDGVKYSGLTPWYATTEDEGEEYRTVGLGNPIYSSYTPEGVTSNLSFAVVTNNFNADGIGTSTGGEHTAIIEEVSGSGSSMTVTYTLELTEPQPEHDQDLDIDVYYSMDEVIDLFKVDPNMTYLVTFNGVAKELQLAPISGADGVYTLGSIATDNFTIQIWKMQDSDSYNFAMEIPASIWTDHSVATDFIAEVSYEE